MLNANLNTSGIACVCIAERRSLGTRKQYTRIEGGENWEGTNGVFIPILSLFYRPTGWLAPRNDPVLWLSDCQISLMFHFHYMSSGWGEEFSHRFNSGRKTHCFEELHHLLVFYWSFSKIFINSGRFHWDQFTAHVQSTLNLICGAVLLVRWGLNQRLQGI